MGFHMDILIPVSAINCDNLTTSTMPPIPLQTWTLCPMKYYVSLEYLFVKCYKLLTVEIKANVDKCDCKKEHGESVCSNSEKFRMPLLIGDMDSRRIGLCSSGLVELTPNLAHLQETEILFICCNA